METLLNNCYGVIYFIVNRKNGLFYIGKTTRKGKDYKKYWGSGIYITRAVNKYIREGNKVENIFCMHIVKYCKNLKDLNYWETKYIKDWNAVKRKDCYNMLDGGNGGWGYNKKMTMTDTMKKRISNTLKAKYKSGELHGWEAINNSPNKSSFIKKAQKTKK